MLKNKIINGILLGTSILCQNLVGERYEIYLQENGDLYEVRVVVGDKTFCLPSTVAKKSTKIKGSDISFITCNNMNSGRFPGYSETNSFFSAEDGNTWWTVYDFKMIQVAIDTELDRIAICPKQKPDVPNPGRVEQLIVRGFPQVCLCSNLAKGDVFFLQDIDVESAASFLAFSTQSENGEHGLAIDKLIVKAKHCDFGGRLDGTRVDIISPVVHFLKDSYIYMGKTITIANNSTKKGSSVSNEGFLTSDELFTIQGIECLNNAESGFMDIFNGELQIDRFINEGFIDITGMFFLENIQNKDSLELGNINFLNLSWSKPVITYQPKELPPLPAAEPVPAPKPIPSVAVPKPAPAPAAPKTLTYYTFKDDIFKPGDFRRPWGFYPIPFIFHYRGGGNDSKWSGDPGNIRIMEYSKSVPLPSCHAAIPGFIQGQGVIEDHVDYMVIVCKIRAGETMCNYFTHLWSMDRMYMGTREAPNAGKRTTIIDSGVFEAHNIQIINGELGNGGLVQQSQVFHDGNMLSGNCARFNITAFPADGWFVSVYNAGENARCGNVAGNQFNRAIVIHWYFVRDGMPVADPWLKSVLDNWNSWEKIPLNPVRLQPQFKPQDK